MQLANQYKEQNAFFISAYKAEELLLGFMQSSAVFRKSKLLSKFYLMQYVRL